MKLTKVEASTEIDSPISDVFAYASDWKHWEEWWVGATDFKPTTKIDRGNGARYSYKAWVAGMKLNLETESHYFKENVGWQGIVREGLPHKIQWLFEYKAGKTKLIYILEYDLPWLLIGPLLNIFIVRPGWQRRLDKSLNNLKIHFEGSQEIKA
jgi:hypothetical protein